MFHFTERTIPCFETLKSMLPMEGFQKYFFCTKATPPFTQFNETCPLYEEGWLCPCRIGFGWPEGTGGCDALCTKYSFHSQLENLKYV